MLLFCYLSLGFCHCSWSRQQWEVQNSFLAPPGNVGEVLYILNVWRHLVYGSVKHLRPRAVGAPSPEAAFTTTCLRTALQKCLMYCRETRFLGWVWRPRSWGCSIYILGTAEPHRVPKGSVLNLAPGSPTLRNPTSSRELPMGRQNGACSVEFPLKRDRSSTTSTTANPLSHLTCRSKHFSVKQL